MKKTPDKKITDNIKQPIFTLSSDAKVKVSLWALATQPLALFFSNWQNFFLFNIPLALLLSICSLLTKHSILCGFGTDFSLSSTFCSDSVSLYYTDMFLRLLLLFFLVMKWYRFSLQKDSFTMKKLFCFGKTEAKTLGILILFTIINILPLLGLFLLIVRTPNPNWKIEILYFTSIAWVFLLPIISIRFYSIISFAIEGGKIPSLKQIWNQTSGNMLKFLLSISILCFLSLFLITQYFAFARNLTNLHFLGILSTEFEYNILITFFIVYFTNYCYTQKNLFFKGDNNDK